MAMKHLHRRQTITPAQHPLKKRLTLLRPMEAQMPDIGVRGRMPPPQA
ncbi:MULTISPECIES: hypothetical protein [Serratia]|nr:MULTISPECIES: hypothetical protein [Serratia]